MSFPEPVMTSISAASTSAYQSPLQRLQDELQSEVSSGAISSSDQDALSSALTDIDSSLQASQPSPGASGTRPSPDDIQSKINDLISSEVSSGKLTSDQATELQKVFSNTFASGGPSALGGAGAPGGVGGHHHGGHGGADASSSTDSSSSTTDASDLLQQFLQSLKDSQSSSATGYDASGDSSNSGTASALLVDYQS
jgi:hypothetical protein